MARLIQGTKILLFTIAASILYGWAHDLATATIYPPYFLPPHHIVIVPTENPLQLALIWGVVATWWMGAFFGFLLASAAQIGPNPLPFSQLKRPIGYGLTAVLFLAYFVLAFSLLTGGSATEGQKFAAVLRTHGFSYVANTVLAFSLIFWVIHRRIKQNSSANPSSG